MIGEHTHQHGSHEHVHTHENAELPHSHGWHSDAAACSGDDAFGVELNAPGPDLGEFSFDAFIYVPHVGSVRPETAASLLSQVDPRAICWVNLSGSQYNYHEMLRRLWSRASFMNVEHDIEVPPGMVREMLTCPHEVCVCDYEVYAGKISEAYGGVGGALGCTRFRDSVMRRFPRLVENIFDRAWPKLDYQILHDLEVLGVERHRHYPDAVHHHEYSR